MPAVFLIVKRLKVAITLFSALSFAVYGTGCFTSGYLEKEFSRYGFARERRLIGFLQLCGSAALLAGLRYSLLGRSGAAGLALMMGCAILVRIRIHDGFVRTLPAILYFLLNAYLALL